MDESLKPCPFCGGEAWPGGRITYSSGHEAWWPSGERVREAFFVNCMSCGIDNKGLIGHQTKEKAIAAWNRRSEALSSPGGQGNTEAQGCGTTCAPPFANHAHQLPAASAVSPEAVWRVCRVIKGDCQNCAETVEVHGDECVRGCYAQAVECINTVETGNPWRKTANVKPPWIVHAAHRETAEDRAEFDARQAAYRAESGASGTDGQGPLSVARSARDEHIPPPNPVSHEGEA